MQRYLFATVSGVVVAILLSPTSAPSRDRDRGEKVWEQLRRGSWFESPSPPGGASRGASLGVEWEFEEGVEPPGFRRLCQTDWDNEATQLRWRLSLNARADLVWLDRHGRIDNTPAVQLGVLRLDGGCHLLWALGPVVPEADWLKAKGDLPQRPCGFDDGKDRTRIELWR